MAQYIAHEQIGYYSKDVIVVVDARLSSMPHAQCGVRGSLESGYVEFYSYSSLIFKCTHDMENDCWVITWGYDVMPNYSATTRRQVGAFLWEYFRASYYDWKSAWEHDENKLELF